MQSKSFREGSKKTPQRGGQAFAKRPSFGGSSNRRTNTKPASRSGGFSASRSSFSSTPSRTPFRSASARPAPRTEGFASSRPAFRSGSTPSRAPFRSHSSSSPVSHSRTTTARSTFSAPRAPFRSSGGRPASRTGGFSASQPSFRSSAPRSFGGRAPARRSGNGGGRGERIDFSRFINKAVITEEVERFIPEHKFTDFKVADELKTAITSKGYTDPSPIQDRAIPHVLQGVDLVGIANTGTGKTAAFLIPLIDKVLQNRKEQVMIIVPTRELAIQIEEELKGFTKNIKTKKIFSVCCVGGANIRPQIRDLKYEYNFIIGTPGRLKDLIDRKMIKLAEFNTIVLDEADRMLDMGFVAEMRSIMNNMPKDRQTLFFSATLSSEIEKLISEFLTNPVRVSVKTQDTSKNVDQDIVRVERGADKIEVLHDLLTKAEFSKVLIFGRTKHGVEKLSETLVKKGIKAESIHGNKNHSHRQRALGKFKTSQVQVLVATDVAARGLDIADVSHVINFDIPATYDDYVHRIGRTGRGGKKGKALTFIG
jgi:superfamily II DNA/RNA helicase